VGYYEYTLFYWMKYYFSDVLKYEELTSRYFTSVVTSAIDCNSRDPPEVRTEHSRYRSQNRELGG
jgi:hypothetical protein